MSSDPVAAAVVSILFVVVMVAWVAAAQRLLEWRDDRRWRRRLDADAARKFYGATVASDAGCVTPCYIDEERKDNGFYR